MNMSIRPLLLINVLILTLGSWAGAQTPGQEGTDNGFQDRAKIIMDRNIFSKDRRPYEAPRPRSERAEEQTPPPAVETYYVLKGIAKELDRVTAFIEDTRTGSIRRYTEDARIANGRLQSLTLDTLDYVAQAAEPNAPNDPNHPNDPSPVQVRATHIRIGQNLLAQAGASSSTSGRGRGGFQQGSGSMGMNTRSRDRQSGFNRDRFSGSVRDAFGGVPNTAQSTEPPPSPEEMDDIVRQLMERRQQETGE